MKARTLFDRQKTKIQVVLYTDIIIVVLACIFALSISRQVFSWSFLSDQHLWPSSVYTHSTFHSAALVVASRSDFYLRGTVECSSRMIHLSNPVHTANLTSTPI